MIGWARGTHSESAEDVFRDLIDLDDDTEITEDLIASVVVTFDAKTVLAKARNTPGSALHREIFNCSQAEAAEQWWLERSRYTLRNLRWYEVEVEVNPRTAKTMGVESRRIFWSAKSEADRDQGFFAKSTYSTRAAVVATEGGVDAVLRDILRLLRGARDRADEFVGTFGSLVSQIDGAIGEASRLLEAKPKRPKA